MRLLLDTHVWLWSHLEPERLSERSQQLLGDAGNELWLSPVSVWEAHILIEKGRLLVNVAADEWIRRALSAAPTRECPMTHEVALFSRQLKVSHEDPADRFIGASAVIWNLTLLTADTRLLGSTQLPCLKAD